jgi:phage FluMu protein Com
MVRTQALASRTIRMHDTAIAVTCPKCKSRLKFIKPTLPDIDECGFERHSFRCESCASLLAGIIDPSDGEPLVCLSEEPPQFQPMILGHIDLQCDTRIQANVIIVPKAVT